MEVIVSLCIIGDSNVGKSSIFLRYIREQFDYSYQPTMNVNIGNVTKKVQLPFETLVSVSLWDLPGREEIDLRRSYYKNIDAAIGKIQTSRKLRCIVYYLKLSCSPYLYSRISISRIFDKSNSRCLEQNNRPILLNLQKMTT